MKKNNIKNTTIGLTQFVEYLQEASVRLDLVRFHLISIIGSKAYFSKQEKINNANVEKLLSNVSELENLLSSLLKDADINFGVKAENLKKEN